MKPAAFLFAAVVLLLTIQVYGSSENAASLPQGISVSMLVALHHAPISILRSTFRDLEDLILSAPESRIQVLLCWVHPPNAQQQEALFALLDSRPTYRLFQLLPDQQNSSHTLAAALNRLAAQAHGEHLYFMSEYAHIDHKSSLERLIEPLLQPNRKIGIVTNRVLLDDGSIFSAGLEFAYARNPNKETAASWTDPTSSSGWRSSASRAGRYNNWRPRSSQQRGSAVASTSDYPAEDKSRGSSAHHRVESEVPVLLFRGQGFSASDPRFITSATIAAAPSASMMVSKHLFEGLGGFNSSAMPFAYFDADFCLRAALEHNLTTFYTASSTISVSLSAEYLSLESDWAPDNHNAEVIKSSLSSFTDIWFPHISQTLNEKIVINNLTLLWNMDCGSGQVLGFTTEAVNILVSIHTDVRTKIVVSNWEECKKELTKIGFPHHTLKLLRLLEERDHKLNSEHTIAVLHKDPGRYAFSLFQEPIRGASYVVGRSMYETTSIPSSWVQSCNNEVDSIWVPTQFNRDSFERAGVNASLIRVVPETIDMHHFSPTAHQELTSLKSRSKFTFLTISKWERRKAWDKLLEAYFNEFRPDEVRLLIRSSMHEENRDQYEDFIRNYTASRNMSRENLPEVKFLTDMVPFTKLPSLYRSAQAFVLASRGEGWGLPLMEAMSMELPTIGTNWSGNLAFMNKNNSYLVDVEYMEAVPNADGTGHEWASPSVVGLQKAMRDVKEKHPAAIAIGKSARSHLLTSASLNARSVILEILRDVYPQLPRYKLSREGRHEQGWSSSFQYSSHTNANTNSGGAWSGWSGGSSQQTFVDASGRTRTRIKINS